MSETGHRDYKFKGSLLAYISSLSLHIGTYNCYIAPGVYLNYILR